eukprot:TRINITY_DN7706_c0_g1_i5.p1 TRINITY_DN7706_c0_g1~~TRINITY_DN7706_c0_g1_i5.p1  ORF type:complete len:247 (-),score=66.72 TRINITY_DN7706_c0_g1_i5:569-1309(-)
MHTRNSDRRCCLPFASDDFQSALKFMEDMEKKNPQNSAWDSGFQASMDVSRTTLQGIAAELHRKLTDLFDVDQARSGLRRSSGSQRTPEELAAWHKFKILVFSRTFAAIYSLSLINILVHVQVSIVQRFNADSPDKKPAKHVFKKFLSMSQFFVLEGHHQLSTLVREVLERNEKFQCPLEQFWSPKNVQEFIDEVRGTIESGSGAEIEQQEAFISFLEKVKGSPKACILDTNSFFSQVCLSLSSRI